MNLENLVLSFEKKMREAGVRSSAISLFQHNFKRLFHGEKGFISESSLEPVGELPHWKSLSDETTAFLSQTVILKLNGGLGTSMGLERAKSLLPIKGEDTFLDFIIKQFLALKCNYQISPKLCFLNSFSTSKDTVDFIAKNYPELGDATQFELIQNKVPKINAQTFEPIAWPKNPLLEWCPPGHGDLYAVLWDSGQLEQWLKEGLRYLFVSNADNIGATLDLKLLNYFAKNALPFLMEVTSRTELDRKGGHLCRDQKTGQLQLRELAQCPENDLDFFQNINTHRFFNTNNLWINLEALQFQLKAGGGFLPLPFIANRKTVDPKDKTSPEVIQLETAVGSALACFEKASAVVVPRSRFAPVKTTSDLLLLRSDVYEVDSSYHLKLSASCQNQLPLIILDKDHYQMMDDFDAHFSQALPSLVHCQSLTLQGPVRFEAGVSLKGHIVLSNPSTQPKSLKRNVYSDQQITL